MRFALVWYPFKYKIHEENIENVSKFFGVFPPLNEMWVAAIAEQHGHECIIVDARTLLLSKAEVAEIDPDVPSTWGKVARNAPCPCKSGKKYKHCHGRFA